MLFIDKTLPTPEENIRFDETLLDEAEGSGDFIFRLWESTQYAVILGRSNKAQEETKEEACKANGIPILSRSSGGGTVLLGPGCLCYSVIAPIEGHFSSISSTTAHVMGQHQQAISSLLPTIQIQGISDLTYQNLKFSGNAQRRKYKACLFHGTFLYDFDLELVERYLKFPTRKPEYRGDKSHREFVTNLPLSKEKIEEILKKKWVEIAKFDENR